MIGRKGKLIILLYVIFLAVLFLMCSTDLIIREPEKEIYQIAVIIEDVRDDNYGNFKKGMDQAALELNADVRFITLYEKLDVGQQLELIEREQQDGTDALIVVPTDEERIVRGLAERQAAAPVVLLGSGLAGEGVTAAISPDYEKMGECLAEKMTERMEEKDKVVFLSSPEAQSAMSRRFLEGAKKALSERGCGFLVMDRERQGLLETLENQAGNKAVIAAESPEILAETAAFLGENPSCREYVRGLYGRGSTLSILNYLDKEIITGICVADEFSMGYFSVCTAVQALEGSGRPVSGEMDFHYIEKEDLRDPAYEKMLYPIE